MAGWKAGYAEKVVTPPMGVALAGYGLKPLRRAEAVLDELLARAIVLDDGTRKAVLCSVDIISLSAALVAAVRARVQKDLNIPPEAVMISATHSHSAPTASYFRQWGAISPEYVRTLEQRIGETIVEAAGKAADADLGFGAIEAPGPAMNRVRKDGPVDRTLRLLAARDPATRKPRFLAGHYALHPVCMSPESRFVSADFPGRMVRDLERAVPEMKAVFFQGALGDINPEGVFKGVDAAQDHGRLLAERAREGLEGLAFGTRAELAFARTTCELPLDPDEARREALAYIFQGTVRKDHAWIATGGFLREWAHEVLAVLAANPPAALSCEVQAIRVGDAAILGLPGEIYTLIGQEIRKRSPFKHTWVVGFANGNIGYVADPRDYEIETYASHMTPKIYGYLPFKPSAWESMVEAGVKALEGL
ncbi:MAG: neutral/alkaline non-lysosomal ceramidase N-terminal domain-containing protein [Planctomycetota bacterium]|nr:neutral/alkaline non-lysosomal ceramidase N-terminal domain-containing protein [Planctomycetota bacterium]